MERNRDKVRRVPVDEWIMAAIGLLLVVAVAAYMLREGLYGDESPPNIVLTVSSKTPADNAHVVQFEARNTGGTTAAQVKIEGVLSRDGRDVEKSEVTLDYVPADSARDGGLFFQRDPVAFDLTLRAVGYARP